MKPTLLLHCGCSVTFRDGDAPFCPSHGTQRVVRVVGMPKPTFRGSCTGPHAKPEDLAPFTGAIVGKTS